MKRSIGDNMIPKDWGLDRGLDLIHKAGFEGVEYWLGGRPWFQVTTPDPQVLDLKRRAASHGLEISNVSNTLDWRHNISSSDPRLRAMALQHVRRQLETAHMLGVKSILVVAGLVTPTETYEDVYKRTVESLHELEPDAARAQVKIGCENCCAEQRFLLSPREFKTFLDEINSPWVGLHFDTGNVHDTGYPEQWIAINGPRITCVHVKDVFRYRGHSSRDPVYTNLFLGDNDWKAIRAALLAAGYDGWIVAEMEGRYSAAPDQQFYDTAAAMHRFISGTM